MAEALFVNPPTYAHLGAFNRPIRFPTFNYATPVMHPPIFLAYAAAYVRSLGVSTAFLDCQVDRVSPAGLARAVAADPPRWVVMETSTPSFASDARVAAEIKTAAPCRVVFCGPHVSALPEESLAHPALDAVVIGEYEIPLGDLVRNGGAPPPGIAVKAPDGRLLKGPPQKPPEDLDVFPFPARDLLPNLKYFCPLLKNPFTFVVTGRGCPYRCTFCNWPQTFTGTRYRTRSAANVAAELQEVLAAWPFRSILFNDDTFLADTKHAAAVCEEILRRGLRFDWACYSRADFHDEEMFRLLRRAGCYLLKIGVESGVQEILDAAKKRYRLPDVERAARLMKQLGFAIHASFVLGLPGETEETIRRTIRFAMKLNIRSVQFSAAVPFPGTDFFRYLDENGCLLTRDWSEYMPMRKIFSLPGLSAERLRQSVREAYRRYYFRPRYVWIGLREFIRQPRVATGNFLKLTRLVFAPDKTRNGCGI